MSMKALQKEKVLKLKGLGKPGDEKESKSPMDSKHSKFAQMLMKKKKK